MEDVGVSFHFNKKAYVLVFADVEYTDDKTEKVFIHKLEILLCS